MSVLNCSRNGCTNIMCDRYSPTYGYICNECFEELIATGPKTDVSLFILSKKDPNKLNQQEEARALYENIFEWK